MTLDTHTISKPARPASKLPASATKALRALDLDTRHAEAVSDGAFAANQRAIKELQATKANQGWAEKSANVLGAELPLDVAESYAEDIRRGTHARHDTELTMRTSSARFGNSRDVQEACTVYVEAARGPLKAMAADGAPDEGSSAQQTVKAIREVINALNKSADAVRKAPAGAEAAINDFTASLDALVATPAYEVVRTGDRFELRFRVVAVNAEPAGSLPVAPDLRGAYAAAHRDEILSAARAMIEAHYEDNVTLVVPPGEKPARLATIAAEVLALERRECAVIWAAREQGDVIDFRPDTDPRAILGVDGPPPERRR